MGRETKILLAILGLLAGVFMGVVSLKLFVPRPPAGTGPDVHVESEPLPLVDPPSLKAPSFEPPAVAHDDPYAARSSRFASSTAPAEAPPRDPFVAPASYEAADDSSVHGVVDNDRSTEAIHGPPTESAAPLIPIAQAPVASMSEPIEPPTPLFVPPTTHDHAALAPQNGPVQGGTYETREGDSWWSLAEQAYGDGRLYRALYAWNRSLNAHVSLVPGTRLDIPPVSKLGAAWSSLLPTD